MDGRTDGTVQQENKNKRKRRIRRREADTSIIQILRHKFSVILRIKKKKKEEYLKT